MWVICTKERKILEKKGNEQYSIFCDNEKGKKEREEALKVYHDLERQIRDIDILELPERIAIPERERNLLHGNILTIHGKAGIGKSQLLAIKTQNLLNEKENGVAISCWYYWHP